MTDSCDRKLAAARPLRGLSALQVAPDGTVVYGYGTHRTQLYVIHRLH